MIDNTKNTQISVFDIKIKRIFVANNVLLNNTIMKKVLDMYKVENSLQQYLSYASDYKVPAVQRIAR